MLNDPLANVLSIVGHYEQLGRKEVKTPYNSKLIRQVLTLLQENGYLGSFEEIEDGKNKWLKINLIGAINKINVIKPRFAIKQDNYEVFERSFLPAKAMGIIIISTSKGLMTHASAKQQHLGGKLICYCY
jgi:small subunit ribosomal protein S8